MKYLPTIALLLALCLLPTSLSTDIYGCKPGQAPIFDGNNKVKQCQNCQPGTYQSDYDGGQYFCFLCSGLNYTDTEGATQCKECKSGTIPSENNDKCESCPANTFINLNPYYSLYTCEQCPPGTTSKAGEGVCNNGAEFQWTIQDGYFAPTADAKAQAKKNLNIVLSSSAALSDKTGQFVYSAINAIFGNKVNTLLSLKKVSAGAKEVWQAWTKVGWADAPSSEFEAFPDNTTLQAAFQVTGQLIVNMLSSPTVSTGLDKKLLSNVTSFVQNVNPKAQISCRWDFSGSPCKYAVSDMDLYIMTNELTNIAEGFQNNDFRQVGEAFGLIIRGVISSGGVSH